MMVVTGRQLAKRSRGAWLAAVVIAAALFALGWWLLTGARGPADEISRTGDAEERAAGRPASLAGYDLLLITLDTLRADRLGAYGYGGAQTPNIAVSPPREPASSG